MDWTLAVTLILGLLGILGTVIGVAIKTTWWVGAKLDEITRSQLVAQAILERRYEERHAENIERFARLETVILKNGNGHNKRRR